MIEKMQRDYIHKLALKRTVSKWLLVADVIGAITATVAAVDNVLCILATACFLLSAWMLYRSATYYEEELREARMRLWLHVKHKHQGDVNRRDE